MLLDLLRLLLRLETYTVKTMASAHILDCLIDSFWLVDLLVWFVMGPGGFRECPGIPRNPDGGLGASRGPPEPPAPKT